MRVIEEEFGRGRVALALRLGAVLLVGETEEDSLRRPADRASSEPEKGRCGVLSAATPTDLAGEGGSGLATVPAL